ncbi:hypothetical protein AB0I75_34140 [Streptomyces sp. NPDC050273]|uniref:hypothetical protein n=1 Tax=Streptomyces sp. NPDC050273 TaxID=3154933 RepID=UPI003433DB2A
MTQAPRVYGTEHDAPATGPQPGHTYRELVGGPLDGQLIEVTGWTEDEITTGAQLITPHSAYGPGGWLYRAVVGSGTDLGEPSQRVRALFD